MHFTADEKLKPRSRKNLKPNSARRRDKSKSRAPSRPKIASSKRRGGITTGM